MPPLFRLNIAAVNFFSEYTLSNNNQKKKNYDFYPATLHILFIATIFLLVSCGDILNSQKRIIGNYYLCEGDDGLSIGFKVSDDGYIGIGHGQVLEY